MVLRRTLCVAASLAVVLVAARADAQPRDRRRAVDPAGLQRLEAEAGGTADVSVHPATGTPRFVRLKGPQRASLSRRAPARSDADQRERAMAFFRDHASTYGLANPDGALVAAGTKADRIGGSHRTFVQMHRGIPVFGAVVRAHFDAAGDLAAVTGTTVPNVSVDPTPSLSTEAARGTALAAVLKNVSADGIRANRTTLYVYRTGLAQGVEGDNHLAYEVEVTNGTDVREMVYVDAHSGMILDRINAIHEGLNRRAYNANGLTAPGPNYPNSPFWVEGQPFPTASAEANNMITSSKETYDFFFNAFGRDSFDGAGATLDSIFNRGNGCPNASWNGVFISFCPGLTTDDVTAHEWGHAYTEYTHGLIYAWQPGALNESYSDIWGEVVDMINGRGLDNPGGPRTANTCSAFEPFPPVLRVNSPASIAGTYAAGRAQFGAPITNTGITGDVVLGLDAANAAGPTTTDGCTPLTNAAAVAGKIAFLDRGTCGFTVKVKTAQDAGAIGVIIGNVASSANPNSPVTMSGVDPTIVIPSISIGFNTATTVKAQLGAGVNASLKLNAPATTDDSYRWLMGEETTGGFNGAIRDMWTPTCFGDPGKVSDAEYTCSTADSGGVHQNSGVPNHGFALLVDGGTYNGRTIAGIGVTKAAHIYFRAMDVYQGPASDFADHADALEQSCSDLTGAPLNALTGGPSGETITAGDCAQVSEMIAAVELRTPPTQCNFQPMLSKETPDRCEAGTTTLVNIFSDDFESTPAGWAVSHQTPSASFTPRDWEWTSDLPEKDGSAFFGIDPTFGTCAPGGDETGVLHLDAPSVSLASGVVAPRLSFNHWVSTEAAFDGGNVKISVDGGSWQLVAPTAFTFNSYNASLATAAQGNSNPLAGQPAFTGSDGGSVLGSWGQSHVNLAPYVGPNQSFRLRFSLGTDGCGGLFGWYVDDVSVYTCTSTTAPTLSINDVAVVEGNDGYNDAVFTVSLSHAYHLPVTVRYQVRSGTAQPGSDYMPGNGDDADGDSGGDFRTVTIPPLSISAPLTVQVRGDAKREANETFYVDLRKPANGTIGNGTGTGTIVNDDGVTLTTTATGGSDK